MTLALPYTRTPIFDELLAEASELDAHFTTARNLLADDLDAHFETIVRDTAPAVIDAEIVAVVDTTPAAPPADDIAVPESIRFDVAMWILATGTTFGGIIWLYITAGVA